MAEELVDLVSDLLATVVVVVMMVVSVVVVVAVEEVVVSVVVFLLGVVVVLDQVAPRVVVEEGNAKIIELLRFNFHFAKYTLPSLLKFE